MDSTENTKNFLFYNTEDGKVSVQVIVDSIAETIWTTQKGMSEIFNTDTSGISRHIRNVFNEGELDEKSNLQKMQIAKSDKPVTFYSLDVIIAVGYRVSSYQATKFRIWATNILKEYLIKGFALDDERLKQGNRLFGKDHFQELLERIREIRASERMLYEKVADIYEQCSEDYDSNSPVTKNFYATVQNKFHYAITGHTAAELLVERADSSKVNMGLTTYSAIKTGGKIIPSDVTVAKNYLSENELKQLSRLVSMFLDHAENLAEKQIIMKMADWSERLDIFLKFNEYSVLKGYGKVKADFAKKYAKQEFSKFRIIQDRDYISDFNKFVQNTHSDNLPIERTSKIDQKDISTYNQSLKQALEFNPNKDKK